MKLSFHSDEPLINALKVGDHAAFTRIYGLYAERLTGFAASKLFDLADVHDIIHDIFVKLWEDRAELNIERNLEGYLFSMVRYRIIDKIRRNITREQYAEMLAALQTDLTPEIELKIAADEVKQQITASLEKLSPRVKEVYRLSREQNLTTAQIAAQLNLSEQTVKNQLSQALKHLRASLSSLSAAALLLWCMQ